MTDAEIRWRLLKHFHGLRHSNGGWVPVTDIIMSPDAVRLDVLGNVCDQLRDAGLIRWKSIRSGIGFVGGNAKITGRGVDVIESGCKPNIEIHRPTPLVEKEVARMRDKALLLELLKRIAAYSKPGVTTQYSSADEAFAMEGYTAEQVDQHLEMLLQMGFVNPSKSQPMTGIIVQGVSPKGYDFLESAAGGPILATISPNARKVFIVHGHDDAEREIVRRYLEKLDFEVIILHEQANQGRTIIEKFVAHSDVGFAVVLLTPDDEGCEKGGNPRPRARQNVVLELGYFVGRLGRDKVIALRKGDVEIPSDFHGVVYEELDKPGAWRVKLGHELEAAGYTIDWQRAMQP